MSGIIGQQSHSVSGMIAKGVAGSVVQWKHGDWTGVNNYGWISSNHTDWSWSRRSTEMTFTNCTPGNKILLLGAPSGYMGINDRSVNWGWAVADGANNQVPLGTLAIASGGMGNTNAGFAQTAAFYNHEGSEDYGASNGVLGHYTVQPTSGASIEFRMLLRVGGGASSNHWLEQRSFSIGFEVCA